jgi:hypothetical protein
MIREYFLNRIKACSERAVAYGKSDLSSETLKQKEALSFLDLNEYNLNILMEYLLIYEYGFLLEKLQSVTWKIQKVPVNKIQLNEKVLSRTNHDLIESYKSDPCKIKGVVFYNSPRFHLIDGYHRLKSSQNKCDEVLMLVATPK